MASAEVLFIKSSRRFSPQNTYAPIKTSATANDITSPALKPLRTRSILPAPIFCPVKLETELLSAVNDVVANVLSFTPAE